MDGQENEEHGEEILGTGNPADEKGQRTHRREEQAGKKARSGPGQPPGKRANEQDAGDRYE